MLVTTDEWSILVVFPGDGVGVGYQQGRFVWVPYSPRVFTIVGKEDDATTEKSHCMVGKRPIVPPALSLHLITLYKSAVAAN